MKKYFTVADIHSFYNEFLTAIESNGFDMNNNDHYLIICGDAFDRGDGTVELFNFLKELNSLNRLIYIRGNHEDLLMQLVTLDFKMLNVGMHHVSNGTARTVADLTNTDIQNVIDCNVDESKIAEFINFINTNCIDYFELGETIFVHGWLPVVFEDYTFVHENWRDGDWKAARWRNGMEAFYLNITPPDTKTVVCGHWHTSFGHSRYDYKCSEWGPDAIFTPYIATNDDGSKIIAIDSCTAWTGFVNCLVFDEYGKLI